MVSGSFWVVSGGFSWFQELSGAFWWFQVVPHFSKFVIIVNGFQSISIITKHSILDVAVALDPPLGITLFCD